MLALAVSDELNKAKDEKKNTEKHHSELLKLLADKLDCEPDDIFDFELCLYDTHNASISGINDEFLNSARLDNLMMSFCSVNALIEGLPTISQDTNIRLVSLFDNEEVGSNTAHGADSNLMEVCLKRLSSLPMEPLLKVCNIVSSHFCRI